MGLALGASVLTATVAWAGPAAAGSAAPKAAPAPPAAAPPPARHHAPEAPAEAGRLPSEPLLAPDDAEPSPPAASAAPAAAAAPPPVAASKPAAPAAEAPLPLQLRSSPPKPPLTLATEGPTSGWWYKLLACALIVAGVVWLIKKRKLLVRPEREQSLKIVERAAIGVRSELLLVRVEGQKLLLGITPSAISRLAVLPDGAEEPLSAQAPLDRADAVAHEPGFERAIAAARTQIERLAAQARPTPPAPVAAPDDDGQGSTERAPVRRLAPPGPQTARRPRAISDDGQAATLVGIGRRLRGVG
jgi:flagellar biogenesis protein FliO